MALPKHLILAVSTAGVLAASVASAHTNDTSYPIHHYPPVAKHAHQETSDAKKNINKDYSRTTSNDKNYKAIYKKPDGTVVYEKHDGTLVTKEPVRR